MEAITRVSRVVGATASLVDRAFAFRISTGGKDRARAATLSHEERLARLVKFADSYDDSLISDPATFFPEPPKVDLSLRRVRAGVWEAAWPSAFEPFLPQLREKYLSRIENRTARARFYLANDPDALTTRPAVIAVHGYMCGQWLFEENAWPIKWLLRRGIDVVLPVLPQHAGRAGARRGLPAFPSTDPRITNEGFRQAISDIRTIIPFLRQRGAPHVGAMGMSLGGYTTALLGTTTPDIDFIAPIVPLSSIADFARDQGRLGSPEEAELEHAALERANWIASPFARPSLVSSRRALVVAAEFDRVTPVPHARRLANHFGCELMVISGGHLLQVGRGAAFRAVAALLEREGIIAPHRARSRPQAYAG